MKVIDTKFKGLKIIQQKRIGDSRGSLRETFRKKIINWDNLIFDYATSSRKNVIRGFHFQSKFQQAKPSGPKLLTHSSETIRNGIINILIKIFL